MNALYSCTYLSIVTCCNPRVRVQTPVYAYTHTHTRTHTRTVYGTLMLTSVCATLFAAHCAVTACTESDERNSHRGGNR